MLQLLCELLPEMITLTQHNKVKIVSGGGISAAISILRNCNGRVKMYIAVLLSTLAEQEDYEVAIESEGGISSHCCVKAVTTRRRMLPRRS